MSGLQFHAEGARGVLLTRHFDAPPDAVFAALVTPALIARWRGPPGWRSGETVFDARPGGAIRLSWQGPAGTATIEGQVLSLSPRLIRKVERGLPGCGSATVETEARLAPEAQGTCATFLMRFDSPARRDAALDGPLPERMEARFLALDEVLRA